MLLASLASLALVAPARSDEDFVGPYPWSYTVGAGAMTPAGQEGAGLESGPMVGGWVGYEVNPAFVIGPAFSFVSSRDSLGTSIAVFGIRGRLSPSPDLTQVYVYGGLAAHAIFYNPEGSIPDPPSRIRIGGNFGFGVDVARVSQVIFGLEGSYHGIVFASGDALSYLSLGVYASLRPGAP